MSRRIDAKSPVVVTDIDGTILTNDKRKRAVISEVMGPEFNPEEVSMSSETLSDALEHHHVLEIYRRFYSNKFLHLDEPIPGAAEALRGMGEAGSWCSGASPSD